jgi:hypothetical protein
MPHPSLTHAGGGDAPNDPSDPKGEKALVKEFEVRVRVQNPRDAQHPDGLYYPGQRAYVRFRVEKEPLLWQWTRRFLQLLQSHENDSKLT